MKRQLTRHDFLIAGSIGLAGTLGMAGCGSEAPSTTEPDAPEEPSTVTETDVVTINGLYVNDGYVNEDNDQLMLLYLLYTVHPVEENLEISSNITTLTINDKNDYSSERRAGACKYMGSYYYSDFIEDVYMGTELKVAETFEIPAADLEAGRTITLENYHIEDFDELLLSTDAIIHCESAEQIAQEADPDGYAEAQRLREPADESTTDAVRNAINGYYWSFITNNISYRIEFFAPNSYTLTALGHDTTGTYEVTNGFVICTNNETGAVNEIPYTWDGSAIDLDVTTGFSVYEN